MQIEFFFLVLWSRRMSFLVAVLQIVYRLIEKSRPTCVADYVSRITQAQSPFMVMSYYTIVCKYNLHKCKVHIPSCLGMELDRPLIASCDFRQSPWGYLCVGYVCIMASHARRAEKKSAAAEKMSTAGVVKKRTLDLSMCWFVLQFQAHRHNSTSCVPKIILFSFPKNYFF